MLVELSMMVDELKKSRTTLPNSDTLFKYLVQDRPTFLDQSGQPSGLKDHVRSGGR
jgi:hypothetical protein